MRVLLTNSRLVQWSGSETYLFDVARWLREYGHVPIAYAAHVGPIADTMRSERIAVVDDLAKLAQPPDVIHGQHHIATIAALTTFPEVPAVAFCHGWLPWEELPVVHPQVRRYIAVGGLTRERLVSEAGVSPDRVRVIPNFVDIRRFVPRPKLPERPRKALVFSNLARLDAPWVEEIRAACVERDISLNVVGINSGNPAATPEQLLGKYDLVFARGRAALEAIASGVPVVLSDQEGIAALVTPDNFDSLRAGNFGMEVLTNRHERALIGAEIDRYDRALAEQVTQIVRTTLSRDVVLPSVVEVYREAIAEASLRPVAASDANRAVAAYLRQLDISAPVPEAEAQRHVRDASAHRAAADQARRELAEARNQTARISAELEAFRSGFLVRRILPLLWRAREVIAPTDSRRHRAYRRLPGFRAPAAASGSGASRAVPPGQLPTSHGRAATLGAVVLDGGDRPGLEATVRSLAQQAPRPEIVVVSSAGRDAEDTIRAAGLPADIVASSVPLLPGGMRNLGIAATHSAYVAFLASDCIASPGSVAEHVAAHVAGAPIVSRADIGASYDRRLFADYGRFRDDAPDGEDGEFQDRVTHKTRAVRPPSAEQRRLRLVGLIQFSNESRYLPEFLDNVAAQVDAIIGLDDESTDNSAEILRAHPRVIEVLRLAKAERGWDEPRNRAILADGAARHGAEWVVAVDADERLERGFRSRAEEFMARGDREGVRAYSLEFRELWGSSSTYRIDGIWGRKRQSRLFRVPAHYDSGDMALHGPWAPASACRADGQFEPADLVLYHLAMVDPIDREARKLKYQRLDPDSKWQSIGYDYLTDETGLELAQVPEERGFRVTSPS